MTYSSSSSAARYTISSVTRPLLDLAVRRLDEPEPVDARRSVDEVADEADVRAFRRLDRAHAAVVARVHVSDLEAGALTRQTTGAERREAALVREPRERVRLVHELRQLRGAEELLDRRDHGPDVDQRLRRDRLDVLGRHALAHDPLHAARGRRAAGSGSARRRCAPGGCRSGRCRRGSSRRRGCAASRGTRPSRGCRPS